MTLFELLKEGCEIQFPSGYILKGDPEDGYIDTAIILSGIRSGDGLRDLTPQGTAKALADARHYQKHKDTES